MAKTPETTRCFWMLTIETEQEADGRWIAEIQDLAGCLAYGDTRRAAHAECLGLAGRILAEREINGQ